MPLNIPNLDKLIAHLEAQPPEMIRMEILEGPPGCGACGCICGHAKYVFQYVGSASDREPLSLRLGIPMAQIYELTNPYGWDEGALRYPAHRVIATLKRLRDRFLATGEIVVDWGPEPGAEPAQLWAAPQARELTPPALPETITRLLDAQPITTEGR